MMPKFEAATNREATQRYWRYYYEAAEDISRRHADRFGIVETNAPLGNAEMQRQILAFCGLRPEEVVPTDAHIQVSMAI
jgi:hypothetical protein